MTTDTHNPLTLHITPKLTLHELVALRDNVAGLYHTYVVDQIYEANYYGDSLETACKRLAQRLDAIEMILARLGDATPSYVEPTRSLIDACARLIGHTRAASYQFGPVEETMQQCCNLLAAVAAALDE